MSISRNLRLSQKGFSATLLLLIIIIVLVIAGGIYFYNSKKDNPDQLIQRSDINSYPQNSTNSESSGQSSALSNPASEYCIKVGGDLQSKTRGDGGEYSICNFEDNQSCEEWALYKRQCPLGGVKTIGFDTTEEIYCVQQGGKTTATPNAKCSLPNGKTCSNSDLYNGKCQ